MGKCTVCGVEGDHVFLCPVHYAEIKGRENREFTAAYDALFTALSNCVSQGSILSSVRLGYAMDALKLLSRVPHNTPKQVLKSDKRDLKPSSAQKLEFDIAQRGG